MKNERRHKLAQNSLANFLEKTINSAQDHSATITRLVVVLLIAMFLLLAWQIFASKNKQGFYNDIKQLTAMSMSELDEEQFENTIKSSIVKYPSGVNNATVSLILGDIYFNRAYATLASGKRDQAIAHYEAALEYYTTADKFQFKQQESAESAVWGLAQTQDALATLKEGDFLDTAKSSYERLCKTWPDSVHYELATEQLNWLNRSVTAAFPSQYRQSDPVLFAPDLKIPDITEPFGNIDTTIAPGDFSLPFDILNPENDVQGFDAGLPNIEEFDAQQTEKSETQTAEIESLETVSQEIEVQVTEKPDNVEDPTP